VSEPPAPGGPDPASATGLPTYVWVGGVILLVLVLLVIFGRG